jgi:hypothetical protein
MADNFDYTPGTGETGAADDIGLLEQPPTKKKGGTVKWLNKY